MELNKIKLIIWDLDETFWKGTLSDGDVDLINENIDLINNLVNCGVMVSICSKNDENEVKKILTSIGLYDCFVFKSVNWSPKGERIKQIINEMQLRETNVLFIDDNPSNLAEAKNYCPDINICSEREIPALQKFYKLKEKTDLSHSRLKQYKILEKKANFRSTFASNEDFLLKSNINLEIFYDCKKNIDRIYDLIQRSNQLNFTKIRSSKEELIGIFENKEYKCGYVKVNDAFGDYGIIGFYAMKDNLLEHFVFSCRTLNMGVEQYVYNFLNKPLISIKGPVSSDLNSVSPYWINASKKNNNGSIPKKAKLRSKILLKGPCDISQMFSFIKDTNNIYCEFTYVNRLGIAIEGRETTTHIIESLMLSPEIKNDIISSLPFGDPDMYSTKLFDNDIDFIVFSLFTDPNLGLYKNKNNGGIVAFGEYTNNLTDVSIWNDLINNNLYTANCKFTKKNLSYIKNNYEYLGRITPEELVKNLDFIYKHISFNKKIILTLGPTIKYELNNQPAYEDRHLYNKKLNFLVEEWAKNKKNVLLLDVNEFIDNQESFNGNINHFKKNIYYELSQELIQLINKNDVFCQIKKANFFNKILKLLKKHFLKKEESLKRN